MNVKEFKAYFKGWFDATVFDDNNDKFYSPIMALYDTAMDIEETVPEQRNMFRTSSNFTTFQKHISDEPKTIDEIKEEIEKSKV